MLTWWLSLEPDYKLLYEWLLGMFLGYSGVFLFALKRYYRNYTKYLKDEWGRMPALLSDRDGDEFGDDEKLGIVLFAFFGPLLWPITLPLVAAIVLIFKLKDLRLFTEILNPLYWTRRLAIKKNKVVILTSPNPEVRALVGRESK